MSLDRTKTLEYARRYWNRPCSDGYFMLTDKAVRIEDERKRLKAPASDGWKALFIPDLDSAGEIQRESAVFQDPDGNEKLIHGWRGIADCAHYISQCLSSGNVKIHELSVPKLVAKLQGRRDIKTLGLKLSQNKAAQILELDVFKKGDVIAYFNVDPQGDYSGRQNYTHSTLYLGKDSSNVGRITCHTVCRHGTRPANDEWWLKAGSYHYTLLHFTDGDPVAKNARHFEGWWKIEYFGRTEYYRFRKDGILHWTSKAPKSASDRIDTKMRYMGHWFQFPTALQICWQHTGTTERWAVTSASNEYSILVNGHKGTAKKLFT